MTRRSLSRTARVRVFEAAGGRCHICGGKIDGVRERWEVEHVKPLWDGGEDDESNMAPAHAKCHAPKTAEEAGQRAESKRWKAKMLGVRKATRRPFPGSRAHGWKRKVTGEWVPRDPREREKPK